MSKQSEFVSNTWTNLIEEEPSFLDLIISMGALQLETYVTLKLTGNE